MFPDVVRFYRQRLRIIVSDEDLRGRVPQIRCLCAIVPTANESCAADELLPQFRVAVLGLESRVELIDSMVDWCHAREAAAVESDTQHELPWRYSRGEVLPDRGVGIPIAGSRECGLIQTRVVPRGRSQAVEEVVSHHVEPIEIDVQFLHLCMLEVFAIGG